MVSRTHVALVQSATLKPWIHPMFSIRTDSSLRASRSLSLFSGYPCRLIPIVRGIGPILFGLNSRTSRLIVCRLPYLIPPQKTLLRPVETRIRLPFPPFAWARGGVRRSTVSSSRKQVHLPISTVHTRPHHGTNFLSFSLSSPCWPLVSTSWPSFSFLIPPSP